LERKRSLREVKRQPRRIQRDYERKIAAEAYVSQIQEIEDVILRAALFFFQFLLKGCPGLSHSFGRDKCGLTLERRSQPKGRAL
jgi:hypothetical protein